MTYLPVSPEQQEQNHQLNELHDQLTGASNKNLRIALQMGQILNQLKSQLNHGYFLQYIKENLPFSHRAAVNYMKIYAHRHIINPIIHQLRGIKHAINHIKNQTKKAYKEKIPRPKENYDQITEEENFRLQTFFADLLGYMETLYIHEEVLPLKKAKLLMHKLFYLSNHLNAYYPMPLFNKNLFKKRRHYRVHTAKIPHRHGF